MSRSNNNYDRLQKEHMRQLVNTRSQILHELNATNSNGGGRLKSSTTTLPRLSTTSDTRRKKPQTAVDKAISLSLTAPMAQSNFLLSYRQFGSGLRQPSIEDDSNSPNNNNTSKQRKAKQQQQQEKPIVKLPIFRLPNSMELSRSLELNRQQQSAQHLSRNKRQFVSFSDYKTLRKALLVMLQQLNDREKSEIQQFCRVSSVDVNDAIAQLRLKFPEVASVLDTNTNLNNSKSGSGSGSGSNSTVRNVSMPPTAFFFDVNAPRVMDNFFATEFESCESAAHPRELSLFITAERATHTAKHNRHHDHSATTASMQYSNMRGGDVSSGTGILNAREVYSRQKESLRTVSRGVNLHALGISSSFEEFLFAEPQIPSNNNNNNSNGSPGALTRSSSTSRMLPDITSSQRNRSHTAYGRPRTTTTETGLDTQQQQSQLTTALMSSLLSVQKHSDAVKRSIEETQALLASTANANDSTVKPGSTSLMGSTRETSRALAASGRRSSQALQGTQQASLAKAQTALFILAAERLSIALNAFVRRDLRRSFLAWIAHIRQLHRRLRIQRLLRHLIIRNVILGLAKLMLKRMSVFFGMWHANAVKETAKLRKARILLATMTIQRAIRRKLAKKKVQFLRQRKKYEKVFDATIRLQSFFRCKLQRWRYLRMQSERRRMAAALIVQRIFRGWRGRKRAVTLRLRANRHLAATMIQCLLRCHLARKTVRGRRLARRQLRSCVVIQALIRGFLARRSIASMIVQRVRRINAIKIQALWRGALLRMNRERLLREIAYYRQMRHRSATKIQAVYRGYRNRIVFKILLFQQRKEQREQAHAATRINAMLRGWLARRLLKQMYNDRREEWIAKAREWTEMWSEDSAQWFYIHNETQETRWEPTAEGYCKADGSLVLCSGEIIDDPAPAVIYTANGNVDTVAMAAEEKKRKAATNRSKTPASKLCSECSEHMAIRKCTECGDQFCVQCYKRTHALGSRRTHSYTALGPKACDDCEVNVAERFCVACDENFCDGCWRKLHSHGKRVFHPFCEISALGRVDTRIQTMDGEELSNGYDVTYTQQRADSQLVSTLAASVTHQQGSESLRLGDEESAAYETAHGGDYYGHDSSAEGYGYGYGEGAVQPYESSGGGDVVGYGEQSGEDPWAVYYDDQGYAYYYNSITGVSQYESPYEQQ